MNPVLRDVQKIDSFDFPVWEVQTPHTRYNLMVRSLTVAQEEVIKTSAVSTANMLTLLNQIAFECIKEKPEALATLDLFEKNLSITDRLSILYGIIIASYGEDQEFNIQCSNCGYVYETKASLTTNANISLYTGKEDLLRKNPIIDLPVSKYKAVLCIPTLQDEKAFALSKGVSQEVIRKADDYIVVKELHLPSTTIKDGEEKTKWVVVDNIFEIYSRIRDLPTRDRKSIYRQWREIYSDYGIEVKIPSLCPQCTYRTTTPVNILGELFRLSQ